MIHVDPSYFFNPVFFPLMVSQRVVGIGDSDFRVSPLAGFPTIHERDDAGLIGLHRHHLQVEHDFQVIGKEHGNTGRLLDGCGEFWMLFFGFLDLLFHFPNGIEIFIDLAAVCFTESFL